jgi:prepilin-type N-terminal cleavage/methylation domain-containing protein
MTGRLTTAIQVRRDGGCSDRGFTLTELLVAMLLTSVLLAVIIAPLISVTQTANTTETASQAAATTTAAVESMQAGVSSATQICLPTQITPSPGGQVVPAAYAVRVLTDPFDTTGARREWEQWWIDPATGQLRAQTWLATGTQPTTWRVVTNHVATSTGGHLPFAITSEGISTIGTPPAGNYTATGTTTDSNTPSPDTGTWTYTLHVYAPTAGIIAQTEPTSGTVTAAAAAAFVDQLTTTGNNGTVTYTQSTGSPNLTVIPSGKVATKTSGLAAGNYSATGTTADGHGNTGTWTYTLHVYAPTAGTIAQTTPTSGTVATTGSAAFSDQLAVTGNNDSTVTYIQSTGSTNLAIAPPPSLTRPKLLTIVLTASTGVKATGVSTPVTSSIAALDTAYFTGAGTCLSVVH